ALHSYGSMLENWDNEKSYRIRRRGLETIGALVQQDPGHPDYRDCLAAQSVHWGRSLFQRNDHAGAESSFRNALAVAEPLSREFPERPGYRKHVAGALVGLGRVMVALGRSEEAFAAFNDAVRTYD